MVKGIGVGDTHIALSALAESISRHDGYLFGVHKFFAEVGACHACAFDTRENIECALRCKAFKTKLIERIHHKATADIILVTHGIYILLTTVHGNDGGILADSRGGHDSILMKLEHLGHYLFWSAKEAKPPACHCKAFGKAVYDDSTLTHTLYFCDRAMFA